ncbi:hypothetical protein ABIC28_005157 [Rhodococcus sp. PvR044]
MLGMSWYELRAEVAHGDRMSHVEGKIEPWPLLQRF